MNRITHSLTHRLSELSLIRPKSLLLLVHRIYTALQTYRKQPDSRHIQSYPALIRRSIRNYGLSESDSRLPADHAEQTPPAGENAISEVANIPKTHRRGFEYSPCITSAGRGE